MIFNFYKQANAFNSTKAMCVLPLLFAILLHATSTVNALECWVGQSTKGKEPSIDYKSSDFIRVDMRLKECPAGTTHCLAMTCKLDTAAMRETEPGLPISDGWHSTTTVKMCLEPGDEECEIPNKYNGRNQRKDKKYCRLSCCTGHACNGTLGLRSFGTVAAMLAFVAAAFFLRWN